jgi:hypothetical protein
MPERVGIPSKLRFEVFKRDSFTCQYCGAASPQVVLHCDHIKPVAKGGETELLNLVTACNTCNLGKGATQLDDMSAVERQRRQLEELQERRLQLDMMLQWRDELAKHAVDEVAVVCDAISARSNFTPNDQDKRTLRRIVRKYGLAETLAAADEAFDDYLPDDTERSWEFAFSKINRIAAMRAQEKVDPHIRKLLYIQGVLRNRWQIHDLNCVDALRERLEAGYSIEALEVASKGVRLEDNWKELDEAAARIMRLAAPAATPNDPPADSVNEVEDPESIESMEAWHDDRWHIEMFAACLPSRTGEILHILAGDVAGGGRIIGDAGPDKEANIRGLAWGLRAVGLIEPIVHGGDLFSVGENGNVDLSLRMRPLSPRRVTKAFNRFGSLNLGFWHNPEAFAQVAEVH